MVNGFGDRRNMSHAKGGNFYGSGCINTNCLSGKVAKGATENFAKLNSSVDTSETETEDEQYDFDISTSDTHFESDAEFHQDLDSTSDRKSEPLPSAILSPPRDSFELNTMVGQAQFGRACATEQDLVRQSSRIERPKESLSVDGFEIFESEVSPNAANNVSGVPDGIRKHALFRPGNQRGEEKSGDNCQRPRRKRSRTLQEAWILRKKKYRKRIVRSK